MIVEWLMDVWANVAEWFVGLLPQDPPPEFLENLVSFFMQLVDSAAGLGAWIPWAYLGVVAAALLLWWTVSVSVKGIRWLWGLTPFSGGS